MNNVKQKFRKNFFEKDAWQNFFYVCGIDEVGRGCLAGPLATAAVILPLNAKYHLLKDSKILKEEEREKAYGWIIKNCFYSVAFTNHKSIDRFNIYQATLLTMKKALLQLLCQIPFEHQQIKYVLIDAMPLVLNNSCYKNLEILFFDKGETLSASIAAASIVAKVTRDRLMKKMHTIFPKFNFAEHKGYGTPTHVSILKEIGPSVIHRTSFMAKIGDRINEGDLQQQLF